MCCFIGGFSLYFFFHFSAFIFIMIIHETRKKTRKTFWLNALVFRRENNKFLGKLCFISTSSMIYFSGERNFCWQQKTLNLFCIVSKPIIIIKFAIINGIFSFYATNSNKTISFAALKTLVTSKIINVASHTTKRSRFSDDLSEFREEEKLSRKRSTSRRFRKRRKSFP